MSKRTIIISWISVVLAIAAWVGVGAGAYLILSTAQERANDTKVALTKANQVALDQRIKSLAESTKAPGERLLQISSVDVVSIIDTIDQAGKNAGVDAKVSDASLAQSQPSIKDGPQLRAVLFTVQGTGSFDQIMHAAKLYEELPLVSSVEQLNINYTRSSDPKLSLWHITTRIKVMTTSQLSI